jgi:uncharacterized RDD family membrane protein YckC
MTRASVFARLFAFIIDIIFLCIVKFFLFVAAVIGHVLWLKPLSFGNLSEALLDFSPVLFVSFFFVVLYYFTSLTAHGEQTLGKSIFGIRVVTTKGENIGKARALLRCVCYGFSALPLFLGFVMAFIFRGRALHDILCGTMVVKVHDEG